MRSVKDGEEESNILSTNREERFLVVLFTQEGGHERFLRGTRQLLERPSTWSLR